MKKLPISNSVFRRIIEENNCYVDKSKYIKMLADYPSIYFFLSRPRRFGKSLFVDTLRAAYAGEEELFKGLYLEKNWDFSKKHPVIKISLGGGVAFTGNELNINLNSQLKDNAEKYGVKLEDELSHNRLYELIKKLYLKNSLKVVVLVDEYDKPILDNLTKPVKDEIREILAGFYSVLKDANQYLEFVFLTGVSKFSKTSIFSKLNNIQDLTLKKDYGDICGYTQYDLETVFKDYLDGVDLDEVKQWYNGYNFLDSDIYNPYDILLFLNDKEYKFHWFNTGTPTFLLNVIKEKKYYLPDLNNIELSEAQLEEFDIDHLQLEVLLLQSGYLTIKKSYKRGSRYKYVLQIPNKEVKMALTEYLGRHFFIPGSDNLIKKNQLSDALYDSLYEKDPEILKDGFISFFNSIPSDWYRKNSIAHYEGYYHSMFYTAFCSLGEHVIAEDANLGGVIDLTVVTDVSIFIFEFKMKTNSVNALEQIKQKEYHKKYLNEKKDIFLVGIEFDEEVHNISKFEWEIINSKTNR